MPDNKQTIHYMIGCPECGATGIKWSVTIEEDGKWIDCGCCDGEGVVVAEYIHHANHVSRSPYRRAMLHKAPAPRTVQ